MIRNKYLSWFPFKKDASILEVPFDGDINNKYDYIILYNYDIDQLARYKSLLRDDGHLLIICDNKLSLNYLNGFKYNGKSFSVYDQNNIYTKKEIESFIGESGLDNYKFYYLYPSIDNVSEIFTDSSINKMVPVSINNSLFDDNIVLFDDNKVYELLMNNGITQFFSNAFLVDLSNDIVSNDIDYIKLSFNRDERFKLFTQLDYKNNKVYKKCIGDSEHLKNIQDNMWSTSRLETLEYRYNGEYLECELIDGIKLLDLLKEDISILDELKNNLYIGSYRKQIDDDRFNKVFGEDKVDVKLHWLSRANIDLLLDNIYVKDNRWIIIDPEWVFDFDIPAEFVLYRSLKDTEYSSYLNMEDSVIEVFDKWDKHFVYDYVGTNVVEYGAKDIVDLQELYEKSLEVERARAIEQSTIWRLSKPLRDIFDKGKRKEK